MTLFDNYLKKIPDMLQNSNLQQFANNKAFKNVISNYNRDAI